MLASSRWEHQCLWRRTRTSVLCRLLKFYGFPMNHWLYSLPCYCIEPCVFRAQPYAESRASYKKKSAHVSVEVVNHSLRKPRIRGIKRMWTCLHILTLSKQGYTVGISMQEHYRLLKPFACKPCAACLICQQTRTANARLIFCCRPEPKRVPSYAFQL